MLKESHRYQITVYRNKEQDKTRGYICSEDDYAEKYRQCFSELEADGYSDYHKDCDITKLDDCHGNKKVQIVLTEWYGARCNIIKAVAFYKMENRTITYRNDGEDRERRYLNGVLVTKQGWKTA